MYDTEIGERLMELRIAKHMTREQLSEKVEVTSKFIYDIEKGRKGFSAKLLKRLADELDVSCDYIMYGKEDEKNNKNATEELISKFNKRQIKYVLEILQSVYEIGND